jgi:serine/threonine protein phosphatase PrpC
MNLGMECVTCGGTVAPDGWCWDCGAAQPEFRSHLEIRTPRGAVGVTDRGKRRAVNADAMALAEVGEWTVAVVCDGVSMSPRAERAAQVAAAVGMDALELLLASELPETALEEAAVRAARAVSALAESVDAAPACTYVAGIAGPQGLWTCWIGDSRAYWLPDEGPGLALTEDDAGTHGALSAWLGADAEAPAPQVRSYRARVPGVLLLCTDGLSRYLPDAGRLREVVRRGGARALVDYALEAGGHDNVTAVVIPVVGPNRAPQPESATSSAGSTFADALPWVYAETQ